MSLFEEIARFSLLVPVVASFFIITKADKAWLPFFYFLYAGIITEIISIYIHENNSSNAVVSNIYALVEILMIIWLFYNLKLFRNKTLPLILTVFFILAFILESFLIHKIFQFNLYFNIVSSMAIIILSILVINKIILTENKTLVKHPAFLACTAFIIYFTYLALVEVFYIYGLSQNPQFAVKVYSLLSLINLLANLTYAMVIIWIPRKRYSLL